MPTAEILNSHSISTLKKEISKTNIKGYSKMKKPELVAVMLKHKARFSHIKMNTKTRAAPVKKVIKVKKEAPKPKPATPKPATPKPAPPKPRTKISGDIREAATKAKLRRVGKEAVMKKGARAAQAAAVKGKALRDRPVQGPRNLKKGFGIKRLPKKEEPKKAPAKKAPAKKAPAKKAPAKKKKEPFVKAAEPKVPTQADVDGNVKTKADGTEETARKRRREANDVIQDYQAALENWLRTNLRTGKELKDYAKARNVSSTGSKDQLIDKIAYSAYRWQKGIGSDRQYTNAVGKAMEDKKKNQDDEEERQHRARVEGVSLADAPTPQEVLNFMTENAKNEIVFKSMPRRTYGDAADRSRKRFLRENSKIVGFAKKFPREFEKIQDKALGNVRGFVGGEPIFK